MVKIAFLLWVFGCWVNSLIRGSLPNLMGFTKALTLFNIVCSAFLFCGVLIAFELLCNFLLSLYWNLWDVGCGIILFYFFTIWCFKIGLVSFTLFFYKLCLLGFLFYWVRSVIEVYGSYLVDVYGFSIIIFPLKEIPKKKEKKRKVKVKKVGIY